MDKIDKLRRSILVQNPTDEQKDAIFSDEIEFLLRASPGSGKTWTSCRRFIWRGANWPYSAGGLALLSFTNTAVREFQEATIEVGQRELLLDPNFAGTFDAFVERFMITPFGHLITGSSARPRLHLNERPGDWNRNNFMVWTTLKNGQNRKVPAWEITPFRDENNKTSFKASKNFGGQILDKTESRAALENFLYSGYYTHSQRVYWACRLFHSRQHIAKLIARRFPEIIVDEAQDSNVWLLIMLQMLRNCGSKITLVGDPDQCIYEFSMASATSLPELKKKWNISEKPLSKSFRCNNKIADAVKYIGGNDNFFGRGESQGNHRAYIVLDRAENFSQSISFFERSLDKAGINQNQSAIICRGRAQLESIRGRVNYSKLTGLTKILAEASSFRDCHKDYRKAFQTVEKVIRSLMSETDLWDQIDEFPDSKEAEQVRLMIWRFVKSSDGLPSVGQNGSLWIDNTRRNLFTLLQDLGFKDIPSFNRRIGKRGLDAEQMELPLFEAQTLFPPIRQETIHQVKGESIDGVLVIGVKRFWDSVIRSIKNGESTEDRRLAYVAMTRARNLLVVGLPEKHYNKNSKLWDEWGFELA